MNEPSNFCQNGECPNDIEDPLVDDRSKYKDIPFIPGEERLDTKTISMDAFSKSNDKFDMFKVHNLYATMESRAT